MVEIQYSPIKKIVVHEVIKYNLEDFIKMKVQPRPPNIPAIPFRWVDGIIFEFSSVPQTPELINERFRDGTLHWEFIEFAEMPEFEKTLVNPDTSATWRVIDGSNNTAVQDVIRWLKKQPQWNNAAAA